LLQAVQLTLRLKQDGLEAFDRSTLRLPIHRSVNNPETDPLGLVVDIAEK
jgi:hypothetical protein